MSADVYDLVSLVVKDIGKQNVFQMTHLDHVEDRKGIPQHFLCDLSSVEILDHQASLR
jgi:hypothetical protein